MHATRSVGHGSFAVYNMLPNAYRWLNISGLQIVYLLNFNL